jgi:hypothetical protein
MSRRLPSAGRCLSLARLVVPAALTLVASAGWAQDWSALDARQQAALAPLQSQWSQLDTDRRAHWLALADRFPDLSSAERRRLQDRMIEWSQRSPDERGATRLQFHEAQRWTPEERQERWREYQSLDPQARLILAHRWKLEEAARAQAQAQAPNKRNLLENQRPTSEPPRTASPTTVRARSGATSRPIASGPGTPAAQQQVGVPKVAATPAFVDRDTLLPRRGPQAAGVTRAAKPAGDKD